MKFTSKSKFKIFIITPAVDGHDIFFLLIMFYVYLRSFEFHITLTLFTPYSFL